MTKTEAHFDFRCCPVRMLKSPGIAPCAAPGKAAQAATQEWADVGR
jgi:hypothetical protein